MSRAPRCLYCIHYSVYNTGLPGIFCTCGRFQNLPASNSSGRRGFFIKYLKSTQLDDEIMPIKFTHPSYTKSERDWSHIKNTEEVKLKMRELIRQRENRSQGGAKSRKNPINGKRTLENRVHEYRGLEVQKKLKIEEGLNNKYIKNQEVKAKTMRRISAEKDEKNLGPKDLIVEQLIEDVTLAEY